MLPKTYLSVAPADLASTCGDGISSTDLVKGLRRINPQITVPLPEHYEWYPTQKEGVTCLWLGRPGEGRKICAFRLGLVPEFTQLGTGGKWMVRGWRSVFDKVIAARAATRRQIEKEFKVVLEADGHDGSCVQCRREGVLKRAEANGKRLCGAHQEATDIAFAGTARMRYMQELLPKLKQRSTRKAAAKELKCLSR